MMRINCKVGMKVTTTGDTWGLPREQSSCCKNEALVGFTTVMKVNSRDSDMATIGFTNRNEGTNSTRFKYENIHMYKGSDT